MSIIFAVIAICLVMVSMALAAIRRDVPLVLQCVVTILWIINYIGAISK